MKQSIIGGLTALAVILGLQTAATAGVFDFTYTGTGTSATDMVTGTLTTGNLDAANSQTTPAGYDITGISGRYNGSMITGLLGGVSASGYDNILYTSNTPALDNAGFAFSDAAGDSVNIFSTGAAVPYELALNTSGTINASSIGDFTVTPAAIPVPEPSSLALLGTAMLMLTLAARRRS